MELASFMSIVKDIGLISDEEYKTIRLMIIEVGNKVNALYRSKQKGIKNPETVIQLNS